MTVVLLIIVLVDVDIEIPMRVVRIISDRATFMRSISKDMC